jgi:hypothetical protein
VTAAQDGTNNYLAAEAVEYTSTVVDVQTGTENVNSDAKARAYKVVRDGRIYIHMGGNVYDMLGTQL